MRRLLATTVLGLLLGGLLLAMPRPAAAQEDTLAKIKRTGAMTIGFRESSPPFSFVAANDPKPQGYSIDLCLRIVDGIKKELALAQLDVKWVKVTPETRIASVANGTVDIECGSTTKTLGRMAQVDFTVLTFLDGGSLLTVSTANINKLTDLAGKRVAVIAGTTTEAAVRDMVKKLGLQNVTLLGVKDHAEGVAALDDARIDAYASDRTLLAGLAVSSRNPAKLYLIEDFISYEPYALMVRRGDPAFHLAVDRVLIRLYRSAEVVPIYEKWFGPFPEGGSLIAALYVLNSIPE
jgi:glutamate/aspartate transport system substrate-binding protein